MNETGIYFSLFTHDTHIMFLRAEEPRLKMRDFQLINTTEDVNVSLWRIYEDLKEIGEI